MKKLIFILGICLIVITGCTNDADKNGNVNNNVNIEPEQKQIIDTFEQVIAQMGHENLVSKYDQAIIKTNMGDITFELFGDESPLTVNNFLNLAQSGFYDGTKFHRVIKDFMIQGGDPLSKDDDWSDDGSGTPGYRFQDESNTQKLVRGSLAMANSGPNTNGSQFFVVTVAETPWLDGLHTNFGQVVDGMDVVDKIEAVQTNENNHPLQDITINSIELIAK